MKKLIPLTLCLLIAMCGYSQTLYPKILSDSTIIINYDQLMNANKLFYEGKMYKELYKESSKQISNYQSIIVNQNKIDSLQAENINKLNIELIKIKKSNNTISKVNKYLLGSSIGLALLSIISFIIK